MQMIRDIRKTVIAVKEALFHNGLVYRYKNTDDFGKPTSSFTICTFWLIQALFRIGMKEDAQSLFESLLACGNHLGLFSEDIDFSYKKITWEFSPGLFSPCTDQYCSFIF